MFPTHYFRKNDFGKGDRHQSIFTSEGFQWIKVAFPGNEYIPIGFNLTGPVSILYANIELSTLPHTRTRALRLIVMYLILSVWGFDVWKVNFTSYIRHRWKIIFDSELTCIISIGIVVFTPLVLSKCIATIFKIPVWNPTTNTFAALTICIIHIILIRGLRYPSRTFNGYLRR